jgi:septal ring factor EnvC (AmiA/AmiB activator)
MASRFFKGVGTGDWGLGGRRTPRFLFLALISAALAVSPVFSALAQPLPDRSRTEALARRAAERLQALQREADRLASEERTLLGDLRKLDLDRQIRGEELKRVAADAAKIQAELDDTTLRINGLQESARADLPELQQRLVEIYKLGRARYLRLLLSTPDLRRLGQSTRTVAALAKLDRDRIATHAKTVAELEKERRSLDERRLQFAALRVAAEKAQLAVQRAVQAKTDLIRDIDQRRDLNVQLTGELQTAQQKLQGTLRDLAAGAPVADIQLPLRPFRGALDWPIEGVVSRRFGRGSAPNGIEITGADGARASAIHDGVVAFAGPFAGYGNLVILDHGAQTFSLYGDLLDVGVQKGARVEHGQTVGTPGPIPSGSDGIYFELRVDARPVDPLQWLKRR